MIYAKDKIKMMHILFARFLL